MKYINTIFIFLTSFVLFVMFYIYTRSFWTLLFFIPSLVYPFFRLRKRHV